MEKLSEIEEQFIIPTMKEAEVKEEKEEEKPFMEQPSKSENISEVEAKVDQILLKS